jgi:hypothetical protein
MRNLARRPTCQCSKVACSPNNDNADRVTAFEEILDRLLLADSGHLRPVTSEEKFRDGETERNAKFREGTQNNQTFPTLSSWQVHRSTPFHKSDSLSREQIQTFRYYG